MIPDRTVLLTTVTVLAVVVVASGPLVPGVGFTTGTAPADSNHLGFEERATGMGVEKRLAFGSARVPADGELVPTDDGYRLELAPADLPVQTGAAPATFHYTVRVSTLEFVQETTATVPARTGRTVRLEAPVGTVPADRVTGSEYEATLVVSAEQGDWSGTVAEETVALEVGR